MVDNIEEVLRHMEERQDEIEYAIRRRMLEKNRVQNDIERLNSKLEKINKNLDYLIFTKTYYARTQLEIEKKILEANVSSSEKITSKTSTKEDTEEGYHTYEDDDSGTNCRKNKTIKKRQIGNAILNQSEDTTDGTDSI